MWCYPASEKGARRKFPHLAVGDVYEDVLVGDAVLLFVENERQGKHRPQKPPNTFHRLLSLSRGLDVGVKRKAGRPKKPPNTFMPDLLLFFVWRKHHIVPLDLPAAASACAPNECRRRGSGPRPITPAPGRPAPSAAVCACVRVTLRGVCPSWIVGRVFPILGLMLNLSLYSAVLYSMTHKGLGQPDHPPRTPRLPRYSAYV